MPAEAVNPVVKEALGYGVGVDDRTPPELRGVDLLEGNDRASGPGPGAVGDFGADPSGTGLRPAVPAAVWS